jgi:hypothetical protein
MRTIKYLPIYIIFLSCNNLPGKTQKALAQAGKNRAEIEKVITHFKRSGNPLKLKAAYYLIENLPYQYHYTGKGVAECSRLIQQAVSHRDYDISHTGDSMKVKMDSIDFSTIKKVRDIDVITSSFLIDNIESAFKSWEYPWAKKLSYQQFCEYILPYKLINEKPENWRRFFQQKYQWVLDSIKNKQNTMEACTIINNDLKKWFYFTKIDFPFDPSFTDLLQLQSGRCPEEVQFTTYAMRAMGIPVTYDYVSSWANRNNAHDWNALSYNNKTIPFLGTEANPGSYKLEFPTPASVKSKKAKIFRKTYYPNNALIFNNKEADIPPLFTNKLIKDVTRDYVPVSNVHLKLQLEEPDPKFAYLCVFNNLRWKPVHWSIVKNGEVNFTDMGRGIVYIPMVFEENTYSPCGLPFILQNNGDISFIKANKTIKKSITLDRKYPAGDDNKVERGNNYQLFYWNNSWISLGKQVADSESLTFNNVPDGALLWLRNLDKGEQERIFTINNNKICWW